jgi:DNA integrity scanning protein DisA with diadenylate cyclase activity/mannitol/fructose-specific phosphotransferase system IIA component (Ntr-type)
VVELTDLAQNMGVVELSAKTRPAAIRALVQALELDEQGVALETVLEAIEDREATAQTIVAEGFAMPHAILDWDGEYRVVLGRSRSGVQYAVPESTPVHLIVLFVVSKGQKALHLELPPALDQLFESDDFRTELINARDTRAIERLLLAKAGLATDGRPRRAPGVPRINTILARQALELARNVAAQAILVALDQLERVPWEPLGQWTGSLLVVTEQKSDEFAIQRRDTHVFEVPHASLTRMDRANLGLLLASSQGLLSDEADVICLTGPGGRKLDSVTVSRPETHMGAIFDVKASKAASGIRPAVILRSLSLAMELASEGREAQPVGAMFVIGDTRRVMRHTRQMVLNPFHGYSRGLRSLLDPSLAETIKEFALIDGAFIVQGDGMVVSAGTYVMPKSSARLPPGLGTRHHAAASITAHTQAMAITISQSTGTVTVFRNGQIVLKLERAIPAYP